MGFELGGKVQGVTPARRNFYERNLFYVGFSSTHAGVGTDASTGVNSTTPCLLLRDAASSYNTIKNYSTRLDWIHVWYFGSGASSNFNIIYCNVDTTTQSQTVKVSTANLNNNMAYNWVVPLPPRTEMHFAITTASSLGTFTLQTAEAFGDMPFGNP